MSRTRVILVSLTLALLAAGAADAAGLRVLFAQTGNRTATNRELRKLDRIVIHVTEGSFWGSVRWLRNPRSVGSSHYVVSRKGEIVQLVSTSDIAWHAGNRRYNRRSIGIEHEGWTYRRGSLTDRQYRASARLVAYLMKRAGMPIDREHVIGHDEVPHPRKRRALGGVGGHTDPGPYWKWRRYMSLVRRYAKNPVKPKVVRLRSLPAQQPAHVEAPPVPTVGVTKTLRGGVRWPARVPYGRGVHRVDFYVDGKRVWVDRVYPFSFGGGKRWDTRSVANGRHLLVTRAYGRRGYRARSSTGVTVANPPIALALRGLPASGAARGVLGLAVQPNARVAGVALYVDGRPVSRDRAWPYRLSWDTRVDAEGPHEVLLIARSPGGRRGVLRQTVVVANETDQLPAALELAWAGPEEALQPPLLLK